MGTTHVQLGRVEVCLESKGKKQEWERNGKERFSFPKGEEGAERATPNRKHKQEQDIHKDNKNILHEAKGDKKHDGQ